MEVKKQDGDKYSITLNTDVLLMGTLAGVELGLRRAGVPHRPGGVAAALAALA